MQDQLIEKISEQISSCFAFISVFSTSKEYASKDYHLLKLESKHLDLLLEFLESQITIESYVAGFNLLFSNEKFYDAPNAYPSFSFFVKAQVEEDIIRINEEDLCFTSILRICSENIKMHIKSESYEKISDEIYYSHNVPWLINTEHKGAIEYYLAVECVECRRRCSKEMVATYEDAWEQVNKQFFVEKEVEKLNYDSVKSNFKEIRRFTKSDATYLSPIKQRFWIEFHEWASKRLKKQLNVEIGENDELHECLISQLGYRDRKAYETIEMLVIGFVNNEFKQ